jgi:DnaJ-class molecular chaperone
MDFYTVLGVGRGARPPEIERAYRRLARKYHPNVNPGDPASARLFRQALEAYETLIDPDRRREYDAQGRRPPMRAEPSSYEFEGFNFAVAIEGTPSSTFGELFAEAFHARGGAGRLQQAESECETCRGAGTVRSQRGHMVFSKTCRACAGTGRVRETRCAACAGEGVGARRELVVVQIPAGIADGADGAGYAPSAVPPRR